MLHPKQSFKRKHSSESPPDNTQRDPTFTPYGITPPRNAEWHSKAPIEAQKRAAAASHIPQAGVCSVTREVWPSPGGVVQYAHIVAAAKSGDPDFIGALERGFGLRKNSFNLHSSRNLQPLTMSLTVHHALDSDQIAFIVDDDTEMDKLTVNFMETPPSMRWKNNVHQVFPPKPSGFKYRLIWLPGPRQLKRTFILHRKEIKPVEGVYHETGQETPFNAPFLDYPVIVSHVPPHIMAINAGEKLSKLRQEGIRILLTTYGETIANRCTQLAQFYAKIIATPNIIQPIQPRVATVKDRSSTKRSKLTHIPTQPTSSNRSLRVTRSQHNHDEDPFRVTHSSPQLLPASDHPNSNIAPSIAGPLFHVTSPPSKKTRYGSGNLVVEGLNLDNFTGQPFDYIDPLKAAQIIYRLLELEHFKPKEDTLVPVDTSPSTPAPSVRLSRIPRMSPLLSPGDGDESYYTPSRPPIQPVLGGRNTTDQKANMRKPTQRATISRPSGKGSSPPATLLPTGPISRKIQPATVAAVSIAPSLGQETVPASSSHQLSTPPSRLPSPPSRFRRPSRAPGRPSQIPLASSQAIQKNVKNVPRNGRR